MERARVRTNTDERKTIEFTSLTRRLKIVACRTRLTSIFASSNLFWILRSIVVFTAAQVFGGRLCRALSHTTVNRRQRAFGPGEWMVPSLNVVNSFRVSSSLGFEIVFRFTTKRPVVVDGLDGDGTPGDATRKRNAFRMGRLARGETRGMMRRTKKCISLLILRW